MPMDEEKNSAVCGIIMGAGAGGWSAGWDACDKWPNGLQRALGPHKLRGIAFAARAYVRVLDSLLARVPNECDMFMKRKQPTAGLWLRHRRYSGIHAFKGPTLLAQRVPPQGRRRFRATQT